MSNTLSTAEFEELKSCLAAGGPSAVFERLAEQLIAEKKYHELFDLRLMQARCKHGLPAILTGPLSELSEDLQEKIESTQLEACREVGTYLLEEKNLTEAWMYLRVVGAREQVAAVLESFEPDEEQIDVAIQIALQEGVAPRRGFEWVLEHYGTCNAVTMFEQETSHLPPSDRETVAALMVQHLYEELAATVRADIAQQAGEDPPETDLLDLVTDREWLFQEGNYHIDTSHLGMTVRFARWVRDPETLRKAVALCAYGEQLDTQFQYDSEEPFPDLYRDHKLFFQAQLGERVEEALEFFGNKAREFDVQQYGTLAAEIYITLLNRLGRNQEAWEAHQTLVPPGVGTAGLAPSLLELTKFAGAYDRLQELSQARGDRLSFAAALIQQHQS